MTGFPSVRPKEVVAALVRAGFEIRRQRGSHVRLFNPATRCQATVPVHGRDMKRGTLKTILTQTGLTLEEFRALL